MMTRLVLGSVHLIPISCSFSRKDDESLHYIRFEGLDRLNKEGREVRKDNYLLVYEAQLKPETTLDDLYYKFNMDHPLDFIGHSLSVSDVVVLHPLDTQCPNGKCAARS